MADLQQTLGLTTRTVSTVELDGRPARRARLTRSYPTDAPDLWAALTDPDRLPRWFLPITGDLREGGTYQFEGNAGGAIERCRPPHELRVTWLFGTGAPTWVTLTLTTERDGTRLDLEHVGHVPDDLWEQFGPSATGIGWDLALRGLTAHLSDPEATDQTTHPGRTEAWMISAEGVEFMRRSSDAWTDAAIESGTPAEDAAAAAARTMAVYTGQAEPPQG